MIEWWMVYEVLNDGCYMKSGSINIAGNDGCWQPYEVLNIEDYVKCEWYLMYWMIEWDERMNDSNDMIGWEIDY